MENPPDSYDQWMRGRARRRELALSLRQQPLCRKSSGDDAVLCSFDGNRACAFPSLDLLRAYERGEFPNVALDR